VQRLVREFVLDVRPAQNLLVLKTIVGSAQPVAAALDEQGMGGNGGNDCWRRHHSDYLSGQRRCQEGGSTDLRRCSADGGEDQKRAARASGYRGWN